MFAYSSKSIDHTKAPKSDPNHGKAKNLPIFMYPSSKTHKLNFNGKLLPNASSTMLLPNFKRKLNRDDENINKFNDNKTGWNNYQNLNQRRSSEAANMNGRNSTERNDRFGSCNDLHRNNNENRKDKQIKTGFKRCRSLGEQRNLSASMSLLNILNTVPDPELDQDLHERMEYIFDEYRKIELSVLRPNRNDPIKDGRKFEKVVNESKSNDEETLKTHSEKNRNSSKIDSTNLRRTNSLNSSLANKKKFGTNELEISRTKTLLFKLSKIRTESLCKSSPRSASNEKKRPIFLKTQSSNKILGSGSITTIEDNCLSVIGDKENAEKGKNLPKSGGEGAVSMASGVAENGKQNLLRGGNKSTNGRIESTNKISEVSPRTAVGKKAVTSSGRSRSEVQPAISSGRVAPTENKSVQTIREKGSPISRGSSDGRIPRQVVNPLLDESRGSSDDAAKYDAVTVPCRIKIEPEDKDEMKTEGGSTIKANEGVDHGKTTRSLIYAETSDFCKKEKIYDTVESSPNFKDKVIYSYADEWKEITDTTCENDSFSKKRRDSVDFMNSQLKGISIMRKPVYVFYDEATRNINNEVEAARSGTQKDSKKCAEVTKDEEYAFPGLGYLKHKNPSPNAGIAIMKKPDYIFYDDKGVKLSANSTHSNSVNREKSDDHLLNCGPSITDETRPTSASVYGEDVKVPSSSTFPSTLRAADAIVSTVTATAGNPSSTSAAVVVGVRCKSRLRRSSSSFHLRPDVASKKSSPAFKSKIPRPIL